MAVCLINANFVLGLGPYGSPRGGGLFLMSEVIEFPGFQVKVLEVHLNGSCAEPFGSLLVACRHSPLQDVAHLV